MIVLLVLVSVLALSVETSIDWSTCGIETKCFCPASVGGELTVQEIGNDAITNNAIIAQCEKIGIQSRFFSDDVALFQLQVTGERTKINQLVLRHDMKDVDSTRIPKAYFGCDFNSEKEPKLIVGVDLKSPAPKSDSDIKNNFKIKQLFENLSRSEVGKTVCAVKVEQAEKLRIFFSDLKSLGFLEIDNARIVGKSLKSLEYFTSEAILCNPFSFQEIPTNFLNEHQIQPLKNHDKKTWTCDEAHYTMRFMNTSDKSEEMEKLECQKDGDKDYFFVIHTKDTTIKIEYPETYSIFCSANFAETCKRPACTESPVSRTKCPNFEPGTSGKAANLSCPDNKWVIPLNGKDEFVTLDDPVCKQDALYDVNAADFYFKLPSGSVDKREEARCFTDYDCMQHSNLILPCADETSCFVVDQTAVHIKCKNESEFMQLKVYMKDGNSTWDEDKIYTCNKTSGYYTSGSHVIPPKSQVRCVSTVEVKKVTHTEPVVSESTTWWLIGGVFVCCLIAIAVIYVGYSQYQKRKAKLRVKGRDEWRKLDTKERIAHCKEAYAEILAATADTAENLLAGFDLMETMLDAGTEDIECWEESYVFLKKFHGAIPKIDQQIWHMFARYMFLQAKKIIDKHGWIAPKLIRKGSRKGLIRTVAIQFLSFSFFDPESDGDSEDLIAEGFRQLQYDAWTQYPHCGLLWSVVTHAHTLACKAPLTPEEKTTLEDLNPDKLSTDFKIVSFDRATFMQNLVALMRESTELIDKEEIIPEFGTIPYQAAFAIGAAPLPFFHEKNTKDMLVPGGVQPRHDDGGNVQLGYFTGMCESIGRNPAPLILKCTETWKEYDEKFNAKLIAVHPEHVWAAVWERALRNVIYYGRAMDAKRLYKRFVSADKHLKAPKPATDDEKKNKKEEPVTPVPVEDKTPPMADASAPRAGGAAAAVPAEDKTMPMMEDEAGGAAAAAAAAAKAPAAPRASSGADAAPAASAAAPAAGAAPAAAPAAGAAAPVQEPPKGPPPPPMEHILELEHAQQEFCDAIEEIQESLRKWFAKRTDKEELKTKPVYPIDDKYNLDNRISKDKKTDVEGDKKNPGCDTSQSSETNQKKTKSSSSETDPGAAAAAAGAAGTPASPPPVAPKPAAAPTGAAAAAPVKP